MSREFVERRADSFYLIGSRVPLAHIVREFQRGESPEAIRSHYPSLSLEQVYGAITFYLEHRGAVDCYLENKQREFEASAVPLTRDMGKKTAKAKQASPSTKRAARALNQKGVAR